MLSAKGESESLSQTSDNWKSSVIYWRSRL